MYHTTDNRSVVRRTGSAFTLVELLVVVSIIALLISILLPSLKKAREQAKSVVCLSNLRALGTGVATYTADYSGTMPGPLHPAVYRNQTMNIYLETGLSRESAQHQRDRQLTWVLHDAMGQRGEGQERNVADDVATCPVMLSIVPDSHFFDIKDPDARTGFYGATDRRVFPTHYVINNYGTNDPDQGAVGFVGNPRITKPSYYFGFSPWLGSTLDAISPQSAGRIPRPSDEWMIADAWYRGIAGSPGSGIPQQEGPYQSGWSGEALPHFAPHFKRGGRTAILDPGQRAVAGSYVARQKADGTTNTAFFDGHAVPVASKSLAVGAWQDLMYGFPGTVNPKTPLPPGAEWR